MGWNKSLTLTEKKNPAVQDHKKMGGDNPQKTSKNEPSECPSNMKVELAFKEPGPPVLSLEPKENSLSIMSINDSINQFMRRTQSHFSLLKTYIKREFVVRINKLEENIELNDACISELINMKSCLLEVQQRFYELKQVHRDEFLNDLENMVLQLV